MENSGVLKDESIITNSDWNSFILAQSNNRLKDFEEKANIHLQNEYENKNFFNLSLNNIFQNTIITLVLVLNELIQIRTNKDMSYTEIFQKYSSVFMKDNRIIFVGVFFVIVSMFFMLLCINL
jgi:hypothetical protein